MIPNVIEVAVGELGVKESPANSNKVKYNTWYYGREVQGSSCPWCMAFVQWCFSEAGLKLPYKTASCSALLNWYKQRSAECVVTEPEPGDIIIYNFGHTGIVESVSGTTITAIEGNTAWGNDSNGGEVMRRTRSKSLVTAYIRPFNFAEEGESMSYEQFKEYLQRLRSELQDNDSSQYSEEARQWAVSTGLIQGGETKSFNGMWEDFLTREQLVTVLYRFAKMVGMA